MPYHLCIQVLSYCCMIEGFLRPRQRFDDANICNNACYQEKCKTAKGLTQNQNICNIGTMKSLSFLFTTKNAPRYHVAISDFTNFMHLDWYALLESALLIQCNKNWSCSHAAAIAIKD